MRDAKTKIIDGRIYEDKGPYLEVGDWVAVYGGFGFVTAINDSDVTVGFHGYGERNYCHEEDYAMTRLKKISANEVPDKLWRKRALPTPASDFAEKPLTRDNVVKALDHSIVKWAAMSDTQMLAFQDSDTCSLCQITGFAAGAGKEACAECPITKAGFTRCGAGGSVFRSVVCDNASPKKMAEHLRIVKERVESHEMQDIYQRKKPVESYVGWYCVERGGHGRVCCPKNHD